MSDIKNRTNLAEAFGAFGPATRVAIERMATIRNKFAHQIYIRSFTHPDVLKHCIKLGENPVYPFSIDDETTAKQVQWHFITTARLLHYRMEMISPQVSGLGDPEGPLP
tara:strand:- start:303 stop:629 length:327 start_codon:yes stop_codon:yes gene_type:complete